MFFAINRRRWLFQSGQTRLRHAAFIGIFFAIDRRNMRWILVEIRPADPKFFFVRVDPFPQDFTPRASLGTRLALALDLNLDPLLHLDGVDLWRPLVQRPEVLVDADVRLGARIEHFGAYGRPGGVLHRISRTHRRERRGWRGWL